MNVCGMQPVYGRDIAALFNPRPLVLVGACAASEIDFATVAWAMPVSHNPAMMAFALRKASRTFALLQESRVCSLSTMDAAGAPVFSYCGTHTGWKDSKGEAVAHQVLPYAALCATGAEDAPGLQNAVAPGACVPLPEQALSACVGVVESIMETGDHMLVCVRVGGAYSRCGRDIAGRIAAEDTLLCLQRDAFVQAGR